MRLFDILGPIMVGPSSSHTAGAVKMGYVAQKPEGNFSGQRRVKSVRLFFGKENPGFCLEQNHFCRRNF